MREINFFEKITRTASDRSDILKKLPLDNISSSYMGFDYDYFDNPSYGIGYGGYKYDGRYKEAVEKMISYYGLKSGDKVLEVGCAKGFVIVEFLTHGIIPYGLDYSLYALKNSHPRIINNVLRGNIAELPFKNRTFDLVFSKEVLPHIAEDKIRPAISECMRVSKSNCFFEIQTGASQAELDNLMKWDRTHKLPRTREWWLKLLYSVGYNGEVNYKILVKD